MKALYFEDQGSLSNLQYGELPDPEIGDGQVVVKVCAAALNGFEPMMVMGTTGLKTPLPMVPCGDIAGEIMEIGPSLRNSEWQLGDRVLIDPVNATKMMGETMLGGASEFVAADATQLIRIPDGVSYENAACLQIAYATAYRMLVFRGCLRSGETMLVLGATGGVGTACVQFAKMMNVEVIACGSQDWKVQKLKSLGADYVVDLQKEDFTEVLYNIYGKPRVWGEGGVDMVVNYIGGQTWMPAFKCLKTKGRMVVCGATTGYDVQTDVRHVWSFERSIIGSDGWVRDDVYALLDLVAIGKLEPVIDSVRPLSEGVAAIEDLHQRRIFGKVILRPSEGFSNVG